MRKGRASRTAQWVAFLRAASHAHGTAVRGFADPTARAMLEGRWLTRLDGGNPKNPLLRNGMELLALRTVVIDEAVNAELARGTRQLVILGAGLDGRAFRLTALAGARVFEVDHPNTQAYKRARLAGLTPVGDVDLVPVDFERDSLDAALAAAGHDPAAPTVWIWEGVVMYLTTSAVRATLEVIGKRSATGSVLVANYHTARRGGLGLLLRLFGEPNRSAFSVEQWRAELQAAGFEVEQDSGVDAWTARHGGSAETGAAKVSRIAVGRRT